MNANDLVLVRQRDSNWADTDLQNHVGSIAYMPVQDRRALLAYVDALAAELANRTKANEQLATIGQSQFDRIKVLEAALEPFRHTRVRLDELNEYVFTDLLDGTVCVVAYVRNGEMADDFNERFERIRAALDGKKP